MQQSSITDVIVVHERELSGEAVQTVNARDLHAFLESGKQFSDWIRTRIEKYNFVEGQDFTSFSPNSEKPSGGRPAIEYYVSLDMAKELAMVERNEKGRVARRYFIECERRLQGSLPVLDEEGLARHYLAAVLEKKRLETVIASNTLYPKVTPELGKPHISIKDIKRLYVPYLSEAKIRLVLRYYGQGKTRFQFGAHENANLTTFQREGLDEVFERFLEESTQRISGSRTSVIIDHECFDGETSRVPRDLAIENLGYWAEQFVQ